MVEHTFKVLTEQPSERVHAALRAVLGPLRCPAHAQPPGWRVIDVPGGVAITVRACCDDFDAVCGARLR